MKSQPYSFQPHRKHKFSARMAAHWFLALGMVVCRICGLLPRPHVRGHVHELPALGELACDVPALCKSQARGRSRKGREDAASNEPFNVKLRKAVGYGHMCTPMVGPALLESLNGCWFDPWNSTGCSIWEAKETALATFRVSCLVCLVEKMTKSTHQVARQNSYHLPDWGSRLLRPVSL